MICNKKDWEMLDSITAILLKFTHLMTKKQKAQCDAFMILCAEETKKEKERRAKTAKYIAEKRKVNPDYGRPAREHRKHK